MATKTLDKKFAKQAAELAALFKRFTHVQEKYDFEVRYDFADAIHAILCDVPKGQYRSLILDASEQAGISSGTIYQYLRLTSHISREQYAKMFHQAESNGIVLRWSHVWFVICTVKEKQMRKELFSRLITEQIPYEKWTAQVTAMVRTKHPIQTPCAGNFNRKLTIMSNSIKTICTKIAELDLPNFDLSTLSESQKYDTVDALEAIIDGFYNIKESIPALNKIANRLQEEVSRIVEMRKKKFRKSA